MSNEKCELCGEPMPPGEEMFKFHGYSGPCPKPPLPNRYSWSPDPPDKPGWWWGYGELPGLVCFEIVEGTKLRGRMCVLNAEGYDMPVDEFTEYRRWCRAEPPPLPE